MPLATAPCPKCRSLLVYGQRQCRQCGERFDYGPTPPPEPSVEQMREALTYAQWQAQQRAAPATPHAHVPAQAPSPPHVPPHVPAHAPVAPQVPPPAQVPPQAYASPAMSSGAGDDLIDRGRFDDAAATPVQPEAIPGFIDSTLFAAFTPKEIAVERLPDLESTAVDASPHVAIATAASMESTAELELTSYGEVGEVATEAIPGFIDSTLFAAFTPDHVETETPDGLELSPSAFASRPAKKARTGVEDEGAACSDCGTPHERAVCPACGARRRDAD